MKSVFLVTGGSAPDLLDINLHAFSTLDQAKAWIHEHFHTHGDPELDDGSGYKVIVAASKTSTGNITHAGIWKVQESSFLTLKLQLFLIIRSNLRILGIVLCNPI